MNSKLQLVYSLIGAYALVRFTRFVFRQKHSLKAKNILLVGACGGLGTALSWKLAGKQVKTLVLWDRRMDNLELLKAELNQKFPEVNIKIRKVDLSDFEELNEALDEVLSDKSCPLDVVINNAGITTCGSSFCEFTPEQDLDLFRINILSQVQVCRKVVTSAELENRPVHILNVSSMTSFSNGVGMITYGATKAASRSFSEGLVSELYVRGSPVTCSVVCPGIFESKLFDGFYFPGFLGRPAKVELIADDAISSGLEDRFHVCHTPFTMLGVLHYSAIANLLGYSSAVPYNTVSGWKSQDYVWKPAV
jgi:short-subunit dehydrogenase